MFRRTNNGERGKDALGINWKIFTGCSQNRKSKIHKSSSQSTRINTWSKKKNHPANLAHPAWDVEMLTDIFIFQKITSQMRKQRIFQMKPWRNRRGRLQPVKPPDRNSFEKMGQKVVSVLRNSLTMFYFHSHGTNLLRFLLQRVSLFFKNRGEPASH